MVIDALYRGWNSCGRAPPENKDVVVERRRSPERTAFALELGGAEDFIDAGARWEMERGIEIPGNRLRKFLRQPGDPIARSGIAGTIADDQQASGRDAAGQTREQGSLLRLGQIMQDIEERDVAGKSRDRGLNILKAQFHIAITFGRDLTSVTNLARVDIQTEDRLGAGALAQIKRQQSNAAPDVQDRFGGRTQQLVRGLINPIAAQLAANVAAQPALGKLRGHSGTRALVVGCVSSPGFHLLRIIALPD
jgi:hypothetical protein